MFKKGDWIIATKPYQEQGIFDRSYMDCALFVTGVCETHISYLDQSSIKEYLMPIDQLVGRGMVIASDIVVNVSKQHVPWETHNNLETQTDGLMASTDSQINRRG